MLPLAFWEICINCSHFKDWEFFQLKTKLAIYWTGFPLEFPDLRWPGEAESLWLSRASHRTPTPSLENAAPASSVISARYARKGYSFTINFTSALTLFNSYSNYPNLEKYSKGRDEPLCPCTLACFRLLVKNRIASLCLKLPFALPDCDNVALQLQNGKRTYRDHVGFRDGLEAMGTPPRFPYGRDIWPLFTNKDSLASFRSRSCYCVFIHFGEYLLRTY